MLAVYFAPFYLCVNFYLLFRVLRWLRLFPGVFHNKWVSAVFSLFFGVPVFSLGIAYLCPHGEGKRVFMLIGNYWLGILLYSLLIMGASDLLSFFYFVAAGHKWKRKAWVGGVCGGMVLLLSLCGIYQAQVIHVTPYEFTVEKRVEKMDSLHVVLAADLHLGYNIGISQMKQMVEKINEQNGDLVVIAGDIFDNDYEAISDPEALAEVLKGIKSKYGVYACYGNHDVEEKILAGFTFPDGKKKESSREMDCFLEKAGIRLLKEEGVLIDKSFYLYGRPDAQRPGRGISHRKSAKELTKNYDLEKPVLILDHEPGEFRELLEAGADVVLCGHTHDGQMFPGNLITSLLWENSYGYLKLGSLHTVVTSGAGLFGPNMRVGTIAEICSIRIHFS